MASLYQNPSGLFIAQFYSAKQYPRRKRVSLETSDPAEAKVRLQLSEQLIKLGRIDPWNDEARFPWQAEETPPAPDAPARLRTIGGAVDAYMHASRHLSKNTIRTYTSIFTLFRDHLGPRFHVARIRPDHILDWLDGTETNLTTKHKYVHHLGYVFRYLVSHGVMKRDISKQVRLQARPDSRPKSMTDEELEAVLTTIVDYTRAHRNNRRYKDWTYLYHLVKAVTHLGLRLGETVNQRWQDVDMERGTLSVVKTPDFAPKYGLERTIPVRGAAMEELLWFRGHSPKGRVFTDQEGSPILPLSLSHSFLKFRRRAKLDDDISFHSTRHTCATNLLDLGVPITVVKEYMGHRSVKTTMRYVRPHAEKMDYWIERAYGGE